MASAGRFSGGDPLERDEIRDGMRITWDTPVTVSDGVTLRADIYRPLGPAQVPPIVSYGIYGKGLAFQEGYPVQWQRMIDKYPEVTAGTSARYMNWETADPERWVPFGYAIVRIDSRGAGRSGGILDPESPRETQDLCECIQWAADQPWSTGRVGLLGISYYAFMQWRAAALKPPALAAMIPWEGRADAYRDALYHGGIYCDFKTKWFDLQVRNVQHGIGDRGRRNPNTGELVAGPETLDEAALARNRIDRLGEVRNHRLYDEWHSETNPELGDIEVPLLSAANWGGQGLHTRGNFEGFTQASSAQKWLEVHGDTHWFHFYTAYGVNLQRRFFDHFLRGEDNGWEETPPVLLNVRRSDGTVLARAEHEWPIARTVWTELHLDAAAGTLASQPPADAAARAYDPFGDGLMFCLPAVESELEITGPLAAKLFISCEASDADLFLAIRAFDPDGREITFQGALDPHTPIANGWLRASHRRLDVARSLPYRPFHSHDAIEPLAAGVIYELDIEIWPTSIVLLPGCRLALSVTGHDYEYPGSPGEADDEFVYAGRGVGPFTHTDPEMRPPGIFGRPVTLHTGPGHPSRLLVPVIPTDL